MKMKVMKKKNEYQYAFYQSVPIMLGYLFLGAAFGLMLQDAGYHCVWALFMSVFVYAGSMQFVLVTLLSGAQSLLQTFLMTLFINGRHVFYGLSFLEKFRKMGKAYPYMVCSLTDETYSVLCDLKVPEGLDEKKVSFLISLFDQLYWVIGSVAGGLLGRWMPFDTKGIDFSMTALFIVIVVNQWMENKEHFSALTGFLTSLLMLVLLGPDHFLLPALVLSMMLLIVFRKKTDKGSTDTSEENKADVLSHQDKGEGAES